MALQNTAKWRFRREQSSHCIQQVTDVPGNFAHAFANKVPALLARKSRVPLHLRLQLQHHVGHQAQNVRIKGADVSHWRPRRRYSRERDVGEYDVNGGLKSRHSGVVSRI